MTDPPCATSMYPLANNGFRRNKKGPKEGGSAFLTNLWIIKARKTQKDYISGYVVFQFQFGVKNSF